MTEVFFFDSYAVIEVMNGNPNYNNYLNCGILLTKLNIFEVYYSLLRKSMKKEAEIFIELYSQFIIDFDEEIIKNAAIFRLQNKAMNLSMADCIGYLLSKSLGIKFLTGDKEFKDLDNVEFIK